MYYSGLFFGLWAAWGVYWMIAAGGAAQTARREPLLSRLSHLVPLSIGLILLIPQFRLPAWLALRLIPMSLFWYWVGLAAAALGLAFTVWARQHLGSNWSGIVTLKRDHTLVRTGPYGWVRHPIYTGLLLAVIGTALAGGELRSFLGLALIAAALARKIVIEERLLSEVFREEYARYRAEVPALIPFIY